MPAQLEARIEFSESGSVQVERACRRVAEAQTTTAKTTAKIAEEEREAARTASKLASEIQGLDRKASLERARKSSQDYQSALERLRVAQGKVEASQRRMALSTDSARSSITSMGSWIKGIGINSYLEIGRKILGAADALYRFADAGAEVAGLGAEYGRFEAQIESATTSAQVGVSVLLEASGALGIVGTAADVAGGFLGALGEVVSGVAAEVRTLGEVIDPVVEDLDRLAKRQEYADGAARRALRRAQDEQANRAAILTALDPHHSAMSQGAGGLSVAGYGQTQQVVVSGHVYSTQAAREEADAIREAMGAEELYEAVRRQGGQAALDALAQQATTLEQMDKIVEASRMLAAEQEDLGSGSPKSKTKSSTAPEWGEAREVLAAERNLAKIKAMMHDWEGAFAWVDPATESLRELAQVVGVELVDAYSRGADEARAMAATSESIARTQVATMQAMAKAEKASQQATIDGVGSGLAAAETLALGVIEGEGAQAAIKAAFEYAEVARSIAHLDGWGAINHGIAAALFSITAAKAGMVGGGKGGGAVAPTQTTLARPTSEKSPASSGEEERVVVLQLDGRETIRGFMRTANRAATRGLRDTFDLRTVSRSATRRGL